MKPLILLLAMTFVMSATSPAQKQDPQPEPEKSTRPKQNQSFDGTPLDPFKEGARIRVKQLAKKNYDELKIASAELAELSQQLNQAVIDSGEDVISAKIFDRLDKIEKLTKRIRDKAKGSD